MRRRKKGNKPARRRKLGASTTTEPGVRLPAHATAFRADRAVLVSRRDVVRAGAQVCFDLAVGRLEESPVQDPVVVAASPPSGFVRQTGATSYVTVNVGGKTLQSTAIITVHRPDRVLSWVLADYPKFKEYWRFEPDPAGTVVQLHLGYEVPGSVLKRFWQEVIRRRRLEEQARRLLQSMKERGEAATP